MSNEQTVQEIKKAIGAHGAWKLKLRTAITTGRSEATPADVRCDDKCEFGKWMYGSTLDDQIRAGKPYNVIKRLHAEFHQCASKVLTLATSGQKDAAEDLMQTEFKDKSEILVRALTKWRGELESR